MQARSSKCWANISTNLQRTRDKELEGSPSAETSHKASNGVPGTMSGGREKGRQGGGNQVSEGRKEMCVCVGRRTVQGGRDRVCCPQEADRECAALCSDELLVEPSHAQGPAGPTPGLVRFFEQLYKCIRAALCTVSEQHFAKECCWKQFVLLLE